MTGGSLGLDVALSEAVVVALQMRLVLLHELVCARFGVQGSGFMVEG